MGKRSADDAGSTAAPPKANKRSRTGIRAALPTSDDAWRRKLERAKESNVIRAKTLQTYAKVKARALAEGEAKAANKAEADKEEEGDNNNEVMHPERQARIDGDEESDKDDKEDTDRRERRRTNGNRPPKRPQSFFQKAQEEAARKKAEAEARQAEYERRMAERDEARAQRAKHQKAMAKARRVDTFTPRGGRNGGRGGGANGGDNQRRKLGRESGVLLDRVRKMMGK